MAAKYLVGQWEDLVKSEYVFAWEIAEGAYKFAAECYIGDTHVETLYADTKDEIHTLGFNWFTRVK